MLTTVRVEALTLALRISGRCDEVSGQTTFGDLMNGPAEILRLQEASLSSLSGEPFREMAGVVLEKQRLLLAIPRESKEYQTARRAYRLGLPLPSQHRVDVLVLVGPFVVAGKVHLIPFGNPMELRDPAASLRNGVKRSPLKAFFPVTQATVWFGAVLLDEVDTVFINRDHVDALNPIAA